MNRKQLILLIVAGAVIGGLGWYRYRDQHKAWEASDPKLGQKLLASFPMNDVERVTIRQAQGPLHLAKKNETWVVEERGDYPANFSNISDFLRKVWEMKVVQPVKVGAAQLARLELTAPDKGTNSGTLVEFKDKNGKLINSLLLGKKHMKESHGDSPFGGGGWPDGRYLMVGNDPKSVAVVSDALSTIEAKPEDWLNKDFLKVENPRAISVTTSNATNNWKLARAAETNEWKLADLKPGEQLDTGKSSSVTSALSYPSFTDVATNADPQATGLDQPLVASLETFDGFNYTVKLAKKSGEENYYFKVAVSASLPKERTAGKEEKPEDKTKLDKEFQEKKNKLEEKLKAEKALEPWTFIVPKYTVDPLLKERKDLLVEKKEEPKPADKPDAKPVEKPDAKPDDKSEEKPDGK